MRIKIYEILFAIVYLIFIFFLSHILLKKIDFTNMNEKFNFFKYCTTYYYNNDNLDIYYL